MATTTRRPCLYQEDGCNSQTHQRNAITTVNEAEVYVGANSDKCIHHLRVAEELQYRQGL